jgi:hypothetical protein
MLDTLIVIAALPTVPLALLYAYFLRKRRAGDTDRAFLAFKYGYPVGAVLVVAGVTFVFAVSTNVKPVRTPVGTVDLATLLDVGGMSILLGLAVVLATVVVVTRSSALGRKRAEQG